ncbi:MAG: outer membrane protein assembly factor BamB [Rubrivivax sp.]|nr:outer membrane protein assembly factor BamB [Rubrivivax sp.]
MPVRAPRRAERALWGLWSLAAGVALSLVAGCAADRPDPKPLETFEPKVTGRQVWLDDLGPLRFALVPAARDGMFFLASSDGLVKALRAEDGREVWRGDAGAEITAGVGSDGRFTSVVTRANEVVAFDAKGTQLWRKRVPAAVVSAPFVAGERIFVVTVDRVVHAFDAQEGRRLWVYQKPGDPLTLAQPSVLAAYRNTLLAAQGPRLVGLEPTQGELNWDVALATPRGTNEVERLADLVGPPVRSGSRFCARAFQAAVACVDAERGTLLWTRNTGGTRALAGDAERVFGADANDRITAWRADSGDVLWSHERFMHRGLSGMLAVGPLVVFGDADGYVHFLSAASGETQLRLTTDGTPVVGVPVVSGTTVLVLTRSGGAFAFRPH